VISLSSKIKQKLLKQRELATLLPNILRLTMLIVEYCPIPTRISFQAARYSLKTKEVQQKIWIFFSFKFSSLFHLLLRSFRFKLIYDIPHCLRHWCWVDNRFCMNRSRTVSSFHRRFLITLFSLRITSHDNISNLMERSLSTWLLRSHIIFLVFIRHFLVNMS